MITEADYRASKSAAVRALMDMSPGDLEGRTALAQKLADAGEIIDRQTMVWAWDAPKTMAVRLMYGILYAPSFNQSAPADMTKPFPGSIKSSLDIADYPPVDVAPVVPPAAPDSVGPETQPGSGIFNGSMAAEADGHGGWNHKNGDQIQHNGATLVFFMGSSPMVGLPTPLWLTPAKYASVIATGAI